MFTALKLPRLAVSFLLSALIAGSSVAARAQERVQPFIVSSDWVAERLSSEKLVLLHVGSRAEYGAGHIPGASYISLYMIGVRDASGLHLQLAPVAQLDSVFESMGVSPPRFPRPSRAR